MSASKVASIRALQELQGIVVARKNNKYTPLIHEAENRVNDAKKAISLRIEKEIEEHAVEKYAGYGLKVIPVCHRSNSYHKDDVVRPELRITLFDGIPSVDVEKLKEQEKEACKNIDDWYFQAVQAVASQVDLPATPEF
jgi:hypothetical protein